MESVPSKEKNNAWDSVSSGERDITLLRKVCVGKAVVFPESCVYVRVGHKEGEILKN